MPQRIKCDGCGAVLYEGVELKSPSDIIFTYNGRCMRCGRKLSSDPLKVDIKTLERKARL